MMINIDWGAVAAFGVGIIVGAFIGMILFAVISANGRDE